MCACGLLLSFKPAQAQPLAQTTWEEFIHLAVGEDGKDLQGLDPAAPEPIADSLSVPGWGLSGALSYGPAGPPEFTAHSYGKAISWSSQHSLGDSIADTRGLVTFEFLVRTTSPPPVPVSGVPVTVSIHGKTFIRGTVACSPSVCFVDGYPAAFVQLLVVSQGMTLINRTVTSASETGSDHIVNVGQTLYLEPDIAVDGSIETHTSVRMNRFHGSGQWGEATATIGSGIEISTDLIPGTDSKYSDYFQIEYGPGYWALGNPAPVQTSTWGKIKAQYLQD
jgi:hypothetical protein